MDILLTVLFEIQESTLVGRTHHGNTTRVKKITFSPYSVEELQPELDKAIKELAIDIERTYHFRLIAKPISHSIIKL